MRISRVMVYMLSLLAIVILFSYDATYAGENVMTDSYISEKIIGTWICRHEGDYCETTYYENGTMEGNGKIPIDEGTFTFTFRGKWQVENGYLIEICQEIIPAVLPPGHESRDKILSISENEVVLMTSDGEIHTHTKKELNLIFEKSLQRTTRFSANSTLSSALAYYQR